jgi:hypothetical protein
VRRLFALEVALALVVLVWCASAFALNSDLDISRYAHTGWRVHGILTEGAIL